MSAPPFRLAYTLRASKVLDELAGSAATKVKLKKVKKALRLLQQQGPTYPGLNSHKYSSLSGPAGEEVWEIYVENKTPTAWRIWWIYGPGEDDITIVDIGPHPD